MAATGRGSLRPHQTSKGPNFLVVGLLFVVVVLSYNYWMVSVTKNQQTYDISALQTSLQKLRFADSQLKVGGCVCIVILYCLSQNIIVSYIT